MNYLLPERLDSLAREYALGTLAGPARRRFERVLRSSPAASMAVDVWCQHLSVLNGTIVPMQPPKGTWRKIEQRLFASPEAVSSHRVLRALQGLVSGRALGGALAGALLCLTLLRTMPGVADLEPRTDRLPASYVGLLLDATGKPTLVASSRRQGRQLTVKLLQPLDVPAGRVAQLWALPGDGSAPIPIGTVSTKGSSQIALPDASEKLFFAVSRLAVSFEITPARPGDSPSGDFALIGHCVKVW